MDNYKIKVKDEAEGKEAQELFFELGYRWNHNGKTYFKVSSGEILAYSTGSLFQIGNESGQELTLPQLRDLVAQSKSNVHEYLDPNDNCKLCLISPSDAAHWMIEVPEGAELYVYWRENDTYNFQVDKSYFENGSWQPCAWTVEEIKSDKAGAKILWSRKPKQDPALISGAEALRALADGKEVEFKHDTQGWVTCLGLNIEQVICGLFQLRLKPQTIKLELELPKPFEPKDGDIYWFITCRTGKGYSCRNHKARHGDSGMQFGAYRTEEDIKQVVEQLRKIRGAS